MNFALVYVNFSVHGFSDNDLDSVDVGLCRLVYHLLEWLLLHGPWQTLPSSGGESVRCSQPRGVRPSSLFHHVLPHLWHQE